MKNLLMYPLGVIIALIPLNLLTTKFNEKADIQPVNTVIGDVSFIKEFGKLPDASTDENLRIQTHLIYIEQHLRQKDVTHLPTHLQKNRFALLDHLKNYTQKAKFPKNYDHPGVRKPCFIDRDGTICAVGYLVEQSAGRQLAEKINSLFQYEEILKMRLPELSAWVAQSGLTLEECAMIQPAYNHIPAPAQPIVSNRISAGYGIGSSLLGGMNLSINALNLSQINNPNGSKVVPVLGLVSGTASTVWGIANFKDEEVVTYDFNSGTSSRTIYENQNKLSMVNIGLGAATLLTSAYKLLTHREPKAKKFSWNIQSTPTVANRNGFIVSLQQRF